MIVKISESEWKFFIACIAFLSKVTKTELSLFQRKLEEEVKNDQKEKKENQEVLKSLKKEREQFIEEQQRYEIHMSIISNNLM